MDPGKAWRGMVAAGKGLLARRNALVFSGDQR